MAFTTPFTKLDYANCFKYPAVANNLSLRIAFRSLEKHHTTEYYLLIIQQIIGYLRCMCDMQIITNEVFNDCVQDLHYMWDTLKANQK